MTYIRTRAVRWAMCAGKHKHKSRGAAEAHVRALQRLFGEDIEKEPYCCHFCHKWHVGGSKEEE